MAAAGGNEVGRISIRVVPNTDKFRDRLKTQLQQIERSNVLDVDVGLDTSRLRQQMAGTMAALQQQADRGVTVEVDVDRSLGSRVAQLSRSLSDAGDSAGMAQRTFMGLGRTGWIVGAVFAAAAPAVGLVAGLLAGLPSLAAAGGAGAGAIALGLDGIKKSAETLIPDLDALKASVSGVFEQRLTPMFDQLRQVFPVLESGMASVANGMADMFQGVTDAVTSGGGLGMLENILGKTGEMFSQLQPIIQTATGSFLTLASAGADSFGHLTGSLGTFATEFDGMVQRITSSGAFDSAMQGLSQTLDGILGLFTRLMEVGVGAMGQLGGPLENMLGGLGDTLVAAMPALTTFASVIANVIGSLGTNLAPIWGSVTPGLSALTETLGTLTTGVLDGLGPALTTVGTALSTHLTTALQAIGPVLPTLIESFGQLAGTLGNTVAAAISSIAPHIPMMASAFADITNTLIPLIPRFAQLAADGIVPLMPAIAGLIPAIAPLIQNFAQMAQAMMPAVNGFFQIAGAATSFGTALMSGVIGAITSVVGAIAGAIAKVDEWTAAFVRGAQEMIAKAGEMVSQITAKLKELGKSGLEAGKALVEGLINGIGGMISAAVNKARELASGVANAVKSFLGINSPSKLFTEYGQFTAEGFGNGLDNGFADVVAKTKAMAKAIFEAMREVFGEISGATLNFNFGAVQGQMDAISQSATSMRQSLNRAVTGAVPVPQMSEETKELRDQLGLERQRLDLDKKRLQVQKAQTEDKAEKARIQAEIDALELQRKRLAVQQQELRVAQQYGAEVDNTVDLYEGMDQKLFTMGTDFVGAQSQQLQQDLGMSGNGAVQALADYGMQLGTNFVFNVSNVDEAISVKNNQINKQALGLHRR
ncbi:hypothetical protein [Mycobacterium sp. C31M]